MPMRTSDHPTCSSDAPDARITLTYTVVDTTVANDVAINCRAMRSPDKLLARSALPRAALDGALRRAFDHWQRVADLVFVAAAPGAPAHILIGEQAVPDGYAYTNLSLGARAGAGPTPIAQASICLNPEKRWKLGFDGNLAVYDLEYTLTHEIGHAIGLDHPGPRGHLMSFTYREDMLALTPGDALGAAAIYGLAPARAPVASPVEAAPATITINTGSKSITRGLENPATR